MPSVTPTSPLKDLQVNFCDLQSLPHDLFNHRLEEIYLNGNKGDNGDDDADDDDDKGRHPHIQVDQLEGGGGEHFPCFSLTRFLEAWSLMRPQPSPQ